MQLYISPYIHISLSCKAINLQIKLRFFSQLHSPHSCIPRYIFSHSLISLHSVTSSTQPHKEVLLYMYLSYIYISLLYTYIFYISLVQSLSSLSELLFLSAHLATSPLTCTHTHTYTHTCYITHTYMHMYACVCTKYKKTIVLGPALYIYLQYDNIFI